MRFLPAGRTAAALCLVVVLVGFPGVARPCAVCFGDPSSPQAQGTSNAILFLLVVVAGVLASFAAFFVCLMKRSRLAEEQAAEPGARLEPQEISTGRE